MFRTHDLFMPVPSSKYLNKLITFGACSVPILKEDDLTPLLEEASQLAFVERESPTKTGVIQNFSGCDDFSSLGSFVELAGETEIMLNRFFNRMISRYIEFNDYSLQKYPVSAENEQYAISPHLDHKNCINLIAVYVLKGKAPFFTCSDRLGSNAVEVYSKPGDLILMRGTGFNNSNSRPFHFVGKVTEERLTFGLRQTIDKKELEKYYKL